MEYQKKLKVLSQSSDMNTAYNSFAMKAQYLPPLDFNEINLGEQRLQQYVHSNKRIWQGALPKSFRNYYLELANDRQNAFRSERVNKLVNSKMVRKIENFLDVVVQSNKKSNQVFDLDFKKEILEEFYKDLKDKDLQVQYVINKNVKKRKRIYSKQDNASVAVKYIGVYDDEIGIMSRKTPLTNRRSPSTDSQSKLIYNEYSFLKLLDNEQLEEKKGMKDRLKLKPTPYIYDSHLVNKYSIPRPLKPINSSHKQQFFKM